MVRVPNIESGIIDAGKLSGYLLDHDHPDGGPKARFLESFGFSQRGPDELRRAILAHAVAHRVTVQRRTEFGIMYEVVGRLASPDGRDPVVRSVWIIDDGSETPRLVTLVPDHERSP